MEAAAQDELPIIRDFHEEDRDFIEASWISSYGSMFHGLMSHRQYTDKQRELIRRLMPRSQIKLAVTPHFEDAILGWACAELGTLHYVYVKAAFQRCGIARSLVKALGLNPERFSYTHISKRSREILGRSESIYDPWFLMR